MRRRHLQSSPLVAQRGLGFRHGFGLMRGFSMIEVLIAVAVLGILFAIAYPSYQAFVIEGNRKNVQTALSGFAAAMERYRAENNSYTGAIERLSSTGANRRS